MQEKEHREAGSFYDHVRKTEKKSKKDPTPVVGAVIAVVLLILLAAFVLVFLPYTRINLLELMRRTR